MTAENSSDYFNLLRQEQIQVLPLTAKLPPQVKSFCASINNKAFTILFQIFYKLSRFLIKLIFQLFAKNKKYNIFSVKFWQARQYLIHRFSITQLQVHINQRPIQQQKEISQMDQQPPTYTLNHSNTYIESLNCCQFMIKCHSNGQINPKRHAFQNKQAKGIKLTNRNKIYQPKIFKEPLKIKELHELQSYNTKITERKMMKQKCKTDNKIIKINYVQKVQINKCIDYKNQKIEELRQVSLSFSPQNCHYQHQHKKQSALYSTRKHTYQTVTNSNDYPILETARTHLKSQVYESKLQLGQQSKLVFEKNRFCMQKKGVKGVKFALQDYYEQKGKRIYTVESAISENDLNSNEYSIAEAFQFPKKRLKEK